MFAGIAGNLQATQSSLVHAVYHKWVDCPQNLDSADAVYPAAHLVTGQRHGEKVSNEGCGDLFGVGLSRRSTEPHGRILFRAQSANQTSLQDATSKRLHPIPCLDFSALLKFHVEAKRLYPCRRQRSYMRGDISRSSIASFKLPESE